MIEKTLTLCTSHLSKETAERLGEFDQEENTEPLPSDSPTWKLEMPARFVVNHQYGWIFFIAPSTLQRVNFETHLEKMPELKTIIRFALKHGCSMINFDRDASKLDELESFDW